MSDVNSLDDPIWDYVLGTRLKPYVEYAKKWWETYEQQELTETGVCPIQGDDVPSGMMLRKTNTPAHSPIKGVQIFPFVPAGYLQITGVAGGVTRMISRVCDRGFEIDGIRVVEKHNLPSTYHKGQILCFIPKDIIEGKQKFGKFVYLTLPEMVALSQGQILPTLSRKVSGSLPK